MFRSAGQPGRTACLLVVHEREEKTAFIPCFRPKVAPSAETVVKVFQKVEGIAQGNRTLQPACSEALLLAGKPDADHAADEKHSERDDSGKKPVCVHINLPTYYSFMRQPI